MDRNSLARNLLGLVAGMGLLLAACSAGSSPSEAMGSMDMASMDEHAEFDFGEAADASEADRTIEITATDTFRFDPDEVDVAVGETVTFRITNSGVIVHEFVLGDEDVQHEHEEEMADMSPGMAMGDEPNAVSLEAGETREITWTFTVAGDFVLYGCHQQGHYGAGMVGTIHVTG